jgi:hypothetical protein
MSDGVTHGEALELGQRLLDSRNFEHAVLCYRMLATHFPQSARVHVGLGRAYRGQHDVVGMERSLRKAILLQPGKVAPYFNLANGFRGFDRAADADRLYRWSEVLAPERPEIATARSLALLQLGAWTEGWWRYELRESCRQFSSQLEANGRKVWDGRLIPGHRILLVAEQGAGDAIQFIRYAKPLSDAGMHVALRCGGDLERLLSAADGVTEIVGGKYDRFDSAALLMSLPFRFGATPDNVLADIPYLSAPEPKFRLLPTKNLKVGLTWSGNPSNARNDLRSAPLAEFARLLAVRNVEFFSLQKHWTPRIWRPGGALRDLMPLGSLMDDYADSASLIMQLDLVVTVDTSVAHLAGALGVPVWLLVGRSSDWRWLLGREDSPWYPSMVVMRQEPGSGWSELLGAVASRLQCQATARL